MHQKLTTFHQFQFLMEENFSSNNCLFILIEENDSKINSQLNIPNKDFIKDILLKEAKCVLIDSTSESSI